MSLVNFDKFNLYEIPDLFLCNPSKEQQYPLGGICERKYSPRFNALSELSFKAYEYIDGEKMPYYDYLVNRKVVYATELGYFQIVGCDESGNGRVKYKEVKCQSLEVQLISKKLSLFKGTYKFYDATTPTGTLLQEILDYLPDWSVGTVDAVIAAKYRTFDITDTTFYNFLMKDVEEAYECVFSFDTVNKTISAYSLSTATSDTDIYISYDNVINSIKVEEIYDEMVTAMTVFGAGDLSINQVNPLGTNNIYDFSFYKTTEWMSQGLIDAITAWEALVIANQATYANTLTSALDAKEVVIGLDAELVTLKGELSALEIVKATRIQGRHALATINASIAAKTLEITNKEAEIAGAEATLATLNSQLASINALVSFDNNFTSAQILELQPLIIQSSYVNENFVQTDSMTDVEIQEQAQELYDQAVGVLSRLSEPRYNFSVDSISFPLIKDFETFTDQLTLGAIINLEIKEGIITYPILLGFDIDYDNPDSFSLIFGNRLRLDDPSFQFSDLLNSSISSGTTTKVNSIPWTNRTQYVQDTVTTFIDSPLNAAVNTVISGSAQNITLADYGLRGRQILDDGTYSLKELWMVNNMLAFSDDGFATAKLAIGEIAISGSTTAYGVAGDVIIGNMIAGNNLTITNSNNKFTLDGNGAILTDATLSITNSTNTNKIFLDPENGIKIQKNAGGTWTDTFYADTAGNLHFTGDLSGATGTFSGNITAATITGGTINGTTGTFSGNIYAANLQGLVTNNQISSLSADKITAGTINAVTIKASTVTGGTISGAYISGGSIHGSEIEGGYINSMSTIGAATMGCSTLSVLNNAHIYGRLDVEGSSAIQGNLVVNGTLIAVNAPVVLVGVRNPAGTGIRYIKFRNGLYAGYSD